MPYPTIIPAAIPGILCDTAAAELRGTTAIKEQNRYAELELTATCADIAREAHKVGWMPVGGPQSDTKNYHRHMGLA